MNPNTQEKGKETTPTIELMVVLSPIFCHWLQPNLSQRLNIHVIAPWIVVFKFFWWGHRWILLEVDRHDLFSKPKMASIKQTSDEDDFLYHWFLCKLESEFINQPIKINWSGSRVWLNYKAAKDFWMLWTCHIRMFVANWNSKLTFKTAYKSINPKSKKTLTKNYLM